MNAITILLADDHAIVREGLQALLKLQDDIIVVGEARNGREAVALAIKYQPNVVVMDIAMPLLNGLTATYQLLEVCAATRVLILSAHGEDSDIQRALAVGAAGYVVKQSTAQFLSKAIREVHKGNSYFSASVAKSIGELRTKKWPGLKGVKELTSREMEIVQLVAEGAANKQVAADFGISIKTVAKHRQHLMDKLNIHDTAGLTRYAIAQRIIESSVQITID